MKATRVFAVFFMGVISVSCQKDAPCPAEFRLVDDIHLLEELKDQISYDSIPSMRFVGPDGENILFTKAEERTSLVPKVSNVLCYEDGDESSAGLYNHETIEYLYLSDELDSIYVKYYPPRPGIQDNGVRKVSHEALWGFDRMLVRVSLAECRELSREWSFPVYLRTSLNDPSPSPRFSISFREFTRYGITYESQRTYVILQDNFKFGLSSGLIGFSMCSKDYIRAIE